MDARRSANGDGFTNLPNMVLLHIGTNDIVGSNASGAPAALAKIIDDIGPTPQVTRAWATSGTTRSSRTCTER